MGLMGSKQQTAAPAYGMGAVPSAPDGAVSGCTSHYFTEVNKGSINMGKWQQHLNEMYARGYKLSHVIEQNGNTVQVFEHHGH